MTIESTGTTQELGVSIVIPAYNEEGGIGPVLEQILTVTNACSRPFEVIVVDDGSKDQTAKIVRSFQQVRLVQHRVNRGYGASLKSGIRHACYPIIAITDADGTYPNERIPELADLLTHGEYDMVVGARVTRGAAIPLARRPAKWAIRSLAQWVAGQHIPDVNSGLRLFWSSLALRFSSVLSNGFSFTTTITLSMLINGYHVAYIPIEYYVRKGKSKIQPIRDTLRFTQLVLQVALYFAPIKIFFSLSAMLFALGFFWMWLSNQLMGKVADASSAVIMTSAVQVAVLGLLADLINHRLSGFHRDESAGESWKHR